jgi:hypothetical protein
MLKRTGKNKKSFLNYRHDLKQQNQLSKLPNINFDGSGSISANEIIADWSEFAKDALIGQFQESAVVCWGGHYEQFGRLMYELYAISENRSVRLEKYSPEFQTIFPLVENLTFIPAGPSSTEDRTFYRIWFAMLEHPGFSEPNINDPDYHENTSWKRFLEIVYNELN